MDGRKPRSDPGLPSVDPASARRHPERHLPRQPTLTFEGALAKQFGVTRPTVHQRLPERSPSIGSRRGHQGPRHLRPLPTHSRPSHTRPRRTPAFGRQPHQGRRRPLNRRRTAGSHPHRHSPGPTGPTSHPAGRVDTHVRPTANQYGEETPPPAPELYTPLSGQGHELHFTEYIRVHPHPPASTRPGSGATTGRRGPGAPRHPRDPHRGGQAPHPGGVPPSGSWSCRSGCSTSWVAQTFSTSSRRLTPLPARGPAPGRACAPASAPLQPGRGPRRARPEGPRLRVVQAT